VSVPTAIHGGDAVADERPSKLHDELSVRTYRWHDEARVMIHEERPAARRHVQKRPPSAKICACYAKLGVREPGDYERVWIEATTPKPEVTAEARVLLDLGGDAVHEFPHTCLAFEARPARQQLG
jgi:hypothetical protein